MVIGLILESFGVSAALPIMIVGSLAVVIGTLIFTVNIVKTLNSGTNQRADKTVKA